MTNENLTKRGQKPSAEMTIREMFAAVAMQGLLSNSYSDGVAPPLSTANCEEIAQMAVNQADVLIAELEKGKE